MREIQAQQITDVVERLCIEANQYLPEDVQCAIRNCRARKTGKLRRECWTILLRILSLQKARMFPSARIREWHVYSLRSGRTYISRAEILQMRLTKVFGGGMIKVI